MPNDCEDEDTSGERSEAAVVVLGDVGRSPRMCNHAKMLADEGFDVKIIGFYDSIPGEMITDHPRIQIVGIAAPPGFDSLPAVAQLPLKLVWNFVTLFYALLFRTSAFDLRVILMQNPPALPTMIVCFLVSKLKCAKFSIDWHNYMYSILKDKYSLTDDQVFGSSSEKSKKAKIVRCVSFLEGLCGKLSDYNLCVTDAMRHDLVERWGVRATTFYDRPPTWKFKETTLEDIHDVYRRLSTAENGELLIGEGTEGTVLTRRSADGSVILQPDRPIVLLSSTSWTPDEKFEILLDALIQYERTSAVEKLPRILMIITGKGPLKKAYIEEIHRNNFKHVDVLTPWLEADDYPKILASADLGISLHTSTSGVDLPMKVVDMFGAKVPVLAKRFKCIAELVKEKTNGHLFDDSTELAHQICELSRGFPTSCTELDRLKRNTQEMRFESWEVMWRTSAVPGAQLYLPENGKAKLRATIQILSFFMLILFIINFYIGTFSAIFE